MLWRDFFANFTHLTFFYCLFYSKYDFVRFLLVCTSMFLVCLLSASLMFDFFPLLAFVVPMFLRLFICSFICTTLFFLSFFLAFVFWLFFPSFWYYLFIYASVNLFAGAFIHLFPRSLLAIVYRHSSLRVQLLLE